MPEVERVRACVWVCRCDGIEKDWRKGDAGACVARGRLKLVWNGPAEGGCAGCGGDDERDRSAGGARGVEFTRERDGGIASAGVAAEAKTCAASPFDARG